MRHVRTRALRAAARCAALAAALAAIVAAGPIHPAAATTHPLLPHTAIQSHGGSATASTRCTPWRVTRLPGTGILNGIASVSATDIWAVGSTHADGGNPLIEHWDGHYWRIVPNPAANDFGSLSRVAALSSSDIWAVGTYSLRPVIEHWDGHRWSIVPNPASTGALAGIAVSAPNDAWAVGQTGYSTNAQPLIEHWDGARWRAATSPNLSYLISSTNPVTGTLAAITVISRHDVWAVGGTGALYAYSADSQDLVASMVSTGLIEHWDGQNWSIVSAPTIGSAIRPFEGAVTVNGTTQFLGVAGISANDVWAVGENHPFAGVPGPDYEPYADTSQAIIEHWDGYTWSNVPQPQIINQRLADVAAVSARDVWAVGDQAREHWDGTAWHVVPGGGTGLAVVSPSDVWSSGGGPSEPSVAHYSGHLCYSNEFTRRTVALDGPVGFDYSYPVPETTDRADYPGAMVADSTTNRLFIADQGGAINVIDTVRGRRVRTLRIHALSLARDQSGRHIYATTNDPAGNAKIVMLDAKGGTILRTIPDSPDATQLAVDENTARIFVLHNIAEMSGYAYNCSVYGGSGCGNSSTIVGPQYATVLDITTGSIVRTIPLSNPTNLILDEPIGRVFVAGNDGVTVLDATMGSVLTILPITSALQFNANPVPTIALDDRADLLFVGAVTVTVGSEGQQIPHSFIDVVRASTGTILRTIETDTTSMVVDRQTGHLVLSTWNKVKIIDPLRGTAVQSWPTLGCGANVVSEGTGLMFSLCQSFADQYGEPFGYGELDVFDSGSGTLVAHLKIGIAPDALVLDDQAHQAFVLAQDGLTIVDSLGSGAHAATTPAPTLAASPACCGAHFFPQTRHNLAEPFLSFWRRYGGVATFGYPRTEPFIEDAHLVQYTDRARLDFAGGQVTVAPLGRRLTAGRSFPRVRPFASSTARLYVAATGHSLSGGFLVYWRRHDGALLLGAPISEVVYEGIGDGSGRRYAVQWFENGCLEYHPAVAAVEPGAVGVQALQQRGWLPAPWPV